VRDYEEQPIWTNQNHDLAQSTTSVVVRICGAICHQPQSIILEKIAGAPQTKTLVSQAPACFDFILHPKFVGQDTSTSRHDDA